MANIEKFRTDYEQGRGPGVIPTDELLNKFGMTLNGLMPAFGAGHGQGLGGVQTSPGDYQKIIGHARITSVANTCESSNYENETQAPCSSEQKYPCVFRFWSADAMRWLELESVFRVESGAYWSEYETHGYGPIPTYALHDVVPVMYDPLRNWCVPLHSPPEQLGSVYLQGGDLQFTIPTAAGAPFDDAATVCLELFRNNAWVSIVPELHLTRTQSQCVPIMMSLRTGDFLRLTCGKRGSADYTLVRAGLRLTLAGRIYNQTASVIPAFYPARVGFVPISGLTLQGQSTLRFKDALTYVCDGTTIGVISRGPAEEWAVNVEVFASVMSAGSTASLTRFRLTADLELGSNADAIILTWNGDTDTWVAGSTTISVYDWFNTVPIPFRTGQFKGFINYEGMASFRESANAGQGETKDKYDIVWMERKAEWVTFRLLEQIDAQDVPFEAEYEFDIDQTNHGFSRGRDPNPDAFVIDVYDVTGTFLNCPVDAIGIAKYNDRLDRYEIVRCQNTMIRGSGTLGSDMCGESPNDQVGFAWDEGFTHGEHMLEPSPIPSVALNPCQHKGEAGDTILVEQDLLSLEWRIYDVTKKSVDNVVNVFWDAGSACLRQTKQSQAVEYCDTDYITEDIVCFIECPPIP
jgi:hypothetical protein